VPTGPLHRTTFGTIARRCRSLANALEHTLGVAAGTVVGTLAFNTFRHLECYYTVSSIGAILHTLNPRLFLDQLDYIVNHGEDDVIFVDMGCVAILTQLLERNVITTKKFVLLTDAAHMPKDLSLLTKNGRQVWCYETLLEQHSDKYVWPAIEENTASSLCYTSGTTGNPKGVMYSHRSTLLHTFSICSADVLGISCADTILAIVPLFHANAWGIAYAALMTGAKLVLPGAALDGKSVCDMIVNEEVTFSFAVPTVFLGLFEYMDRTGVKSLAKLNRVTIGGGTHT
jgi:acyl-CoA synthetase (AMP-forming)/AMP-acid ligase II